MINIKLEVLKAALYLLIGAYLGVKFSPNQPPTNPTQPSISSNSKCVATIKKHTNSDGTIDEVTEFLASHDTKIQPPKLQKLGLGISLFTDRSFQVRYELTNHLSIVGKLQEVNKLDSRKDIGIEYNF